MFWRRENRELKEKVEDLDRRYHTLELRVTELDDFYHRLARRRYMDNRLDEEERTSQEEPAAASPGLPSRSNSKMALWARMRARTTQGQKGA